MKIFSRNSLLLLGTLLGVVGLNLTAVPEAHATDENLLCSSCYDGWPSHSFVQNCCVPNSTDCRERGSHTGNGPEYGRCGVHPFCGGD